MLVIVDVPTGNCRQHTLFDFSDAVEMKNISES